MKNILQFPWGTSDAAQAWIVHCGSKSTPMIAQLCREVGLKSRIVQSDDFANAWRTRAHAPRLVILSGGDQSVTEGGSFTIPEDLFASLLHHSTVLGICYGAQLLATCAGGEVARAARAESGIVTVTNSRSFGKYRGGNAVMNHGDEITRLPEGWEVVASTERCRHALVGTKRVWAVQFHPEMDHTENGESILTHVAFRIARCVKDYVFCADGFVEQASAWIEGVAPPGAILCGLSGGVDSAVAYTIAKRSRIAERLHGIFVDTGWFREGETDEVRSYFGTDGISYVDASGEFYDAIDAIPYPADGKDTDREYRYYDQVRRVIGHRFVETFLATARGLGRTTGSLIQGTNVADIIESQTGLKAHHNVGGLPDELGVAVIEPLAGLYKFEIRELAARLGLAPEIVHRQPFPGPGLAIRTWGKLTRDVAKPLQRANRILEDVMRLHYPDPRSRPCQYYVALAPLPSTGLMGDKRVIGYAWVVRMVTSKQRESYTTLDVFEPTRAFAADLVHRLVNDVTMPDGTPIVRVFYEWTGKPPSTTEPH